MGIIGSHSGPYLCTADTSSTAELAMTRVGTAAGHKRVYRYLSDPSGPRPLTSRWRVIRDQSGLHISESDLTLMWIACSRDHRSPEHIRAEMNSALRACGRRLYNNCSTKRFLLEAAWIFEVSSL
jgi:hypothetical protein